MDMKFVVITLPDFFDDEMKYICELFENGLQLLHLRKPKASADELEEFLKKIPSDFHPKIILNDHFSLLEHFQLKGVHLNGRNPIAPPNWTGHISRSCHTLEEVAKFKPMCDYLFLSPIFNSISKEGYASAFSEEVLLNAKKENIIDKKVIALGGMEADKCALIRKWGFGGAAFLGDVWNPFLEGGSRQGIAHFKSLQLALHA